MILNGKENKEAGAICFELRIPRKKNNEIFWKVPSKICGSNLIMEKNKNIVWVVNIFKHHHQELGLISQRIQTSLATAIVTKAANESVGCVAPL